MGCHFLLQGIFLTQGLDSYLLHYRLVLHHCATWEAHSELHLLIVAILGKVGQSSLVVQSPDFGSSPSSATVSHVWLSFPICKMGRTIVPVLRG